MEEIFINLFTGMNWFSAVLLSLGLILMVIEVFVPGFGVFGITGGVSTALGIIVRLIGEQEFWVIISYIAFIILIMLAVLLIAYLVLWAFKENSFSQQSKKEMKKPEVDAMIGKNGMSLTDICPEGKAIIDGVAFFVYAKGAYISANSPITVVGVNKHGLLVAKFSNKKDEK